MRPFIINLLSAKVAWNEIKIDLQNTMYAYRLKVHKPGNVEKGTTLRTITVSSSITQTHGGKSGLSQPMCVVLFSS